MSRPRFYAPAAAAASGLVPLPPEEAHHLRTVLRVSPGADVSIFDGGGREWLGRVVAFGGTRDASVELLQEVAPAAEPSVRVTVAVGLLKGDQMDAVVRDATMLGATEIVPLACEHVSVPARAWRSGAAAERWRRLAIASSKQCGRAVVPVIGAVQPFDRALDDVEVETRLMGVEPSASGDAVVELSALPRPSSALLLTGPEGGWARREIDRAVARGVRLVSLGPRTLRAETAPTVLLASVWTVWGW
jgi:16S rRNA (uracil1498-N3)-methyltransferase